MDSNNNNIYTQIVKYTGIFGSIQGISVMTGVIRNKITALLLGTMGMGMMSLLNSTVIFLSQATSMGLAYSGVREIAACKERGDQAGIERCAAIIRAWSLLAALTGMAICALSSKWIDKLTFTWGDHSMHYLLLSPSLALMAITAGETAILKGLHRLKALALIQMITAFGALVITTPLLYFFNQAAIVPIIMLIAMVTMIATIFYSFATVKPRIGNWRRWYGRWKRLIAEGRPMVKIGLAFVTAMAIGSASELIIRAYLNVKADLDTVGLYNAGYLLAITYAGLFFTSLESDYYPRLSAVNNDITKINQLVNYQTEVSLTLIAPMMCVFILLLPAIVPMLFSEKFNAAIPMAQATALTMMCKSACLPVSYVMLAKGDSRIYICLESLSYLMTIAGVIAGYTYGGLTGTGVGLTVAYAAELTINSICLHSRYGLRQSGKLITYFASHVAMVGAVYASTYIPDDVTRWSTGIGITAICAAYSAKSLKSNLRH
ncbi:MAG: oligosaccharide flippase family protein [Prevotella sp.]